MSFARSRRLRPCRAFSLVEVLLALALLTVLLVAMNQFIFSMGELWGQNRRQRLFDQHVRAVTRYLENVLERAATVPVAARGLRMVQSPVPLSTGGGPLLTFELAAGDRLFPWAGAPLPDVQCMLATAPDRGLVLHWQSRWETGFETTAPRVLVVSPLVTRLDYEYFRPEARSWDTQSVPIPDKRGQWLLPSRLKLHFQYERWSADTVVRIPVPTKALPAF